MRDAYGLIRLMLGSTKSAPAAQDRQTYIPPHIESAMAEHVQQSMPAHLQKYKGSSTYIPAHAQAEMTEHLESSLPPHMKQYAGAYMQQNVVEPSLNRRSSPRTPVEPSAPVISPNVPSQADATVQPATNGGPAYPAQAPTVSQNPDQPYDFITNPAQAPKQPLTTRLPGGSSMIGRIGLLAGGLLALLIVFLIFRGLLTGPSNLDSFVTVAQEQQELIHLAANASQQDSLPAADKNAAATMQASLTSSQAATIQYLTTNKKKVNEKLLNLKVSAAIDKQLTDAAAAGTYNQTFHEIIESKLTAYANVLSQAYKQNPGPKGKTLLQDSYQQAQLLQTQLDTPAN